MSIEWKSTRALVTGGTGSFGNFVVHRLLEKGVKEVRILSRDEKKQYDMRNLYKGKENLSFVLGDIRNRQTVDEAMQNIDIVFQAAALKQVPSCENFPMEAIRTNVLGVENVVESALQNGVKKFVCISTDKAVKPVNVMGMTKALQEKLVMRANFSKFNRGTVLCCVRYGNVLRSRGSVVPFFRNKLKNNEPLTITDERMTRFLLTLGDAIDLVFYAAENGGKGDLFVRKSPAANVMDIARCLSDEVGKKLDYKVIGILPGEKLHEILITEEELQRVEDCGKYYRVYPFWSDVKPEGVENEYCSRDEVVQGEELVQTIARADKEFVDMALDSGEFSKF